MSDNELLEKAKRDYSKGTIYKSAFSKKIWTSSGNHYVTGNSVKDSFADHPWFCYHGEWAEIISLPIGYIKQINYEVY